jgi:hypothetical protein
MAETHNTEETGFTISSSACKHHFGFLGQRARGTAIPDECLTCEKMLDCMTAKPEDKASQAETKPEPEAERTFEDTFVVVEEVEETFAAEKPEPVMQQPEKKVEPAPKPHSHPRIEPAKRIEPEKLVEKQPVHTEKPAERTAVTKSENDFRVESPGMLYNKWTGTVLVSKETFQSWGKKVKEVEIQTHKGKKTTCKVFAVPDLEARVIQIPSKLKTDMEIDDGTHVTVNPVTERSRFGNFPSLKLGKLSRQ